MQKRTRFAQLFDLSLRFGDEVFVFVDAASRVGKMFVERCDIFFDIVELLCLFVKLCVFLVDFIVQRIDLCPDRFFVRFKLFEFFFRFGKAYVELLYQILFAALFFLNAD